MRVGSGNNHDIYYVKGVTKWHTTHYPKAINKFRSQTDPFVVTFLTGPHSDIINTAK
jgi:hypothetical protein